MEKIKVNMSPNPLDVQTIHASQNDGEAREWEFELHNNGELIDTSEVTEQMFFKAYKGGTEQLLPENTSTPTTSPFKGDIRYPQGVLTDQEFTYRQSPTESDGLAKIKNLYGNTLVWNQLIEKGNMTDGWTFSNSTGSYSNNILTFTVTAKNGFVRPDRPQYIYAGHKYFATVDVKATSAFTGRIYFTGHNESFILDPNYTTSWKTFSLVFTNTVTEYNYYPRVFDTRDSDWDAVQIRNCMLIDLTQMGLDSLTAEEFTSLFPLSYYSYNQGSLLSFNGNGIKTVGKNQFKLNPSATSSNIINVINEETGAVDVADSTAIRWSTPYIGYTDVVAGQTYTASLKGGVTLAYGRIGGSTTTGQPSSSNQPNTSISVAITSLITNLTPSRTFVANETQRIYWYYCTDSGNANHQEFTFYPQIELNTITTDFEPYTESTLSLPISTYFPTGMKSAGTVYDELTPRKAITRIGAVDLGSLNYTRTTTQTSGVYRFIGSGLPNNIKLPANNGIVANMTSIYTSETVDRVYNGIAPNMSVSLSAQRTFHIRNDSYTTAEAFKSAMSNVYLYYELATPTETPITTASLVTENTEIPLSNEEGVLIGKCTEQLSENPGFIDAKIKLSDSDGTCYSNKLQLHVERSPQ